MSSLQKLARRPKPAGEETSALAEPQREQQEATLPEENYGLFEISDRAAGLEGSADEGPVHHVDIVAVHGLMGHWANTWIAGNSPGNSMFLRDRIPTDLSNIGVRPRIFSYGYDSAVVFSKSVVTIDQAADILLERLLGKRKKPEEKGRPIIFIAHSLGGLVVKQAMIQAWTNIQRYNELLDSVKGCLFLGVPHGGADSAYWAKFPARMIPYVTFGLRGNPSFLKSLESKSEDCVRISRDFVHRAVSLKIRTFYETEKLGNMIVVVRSSATLNLPNEVAVPLGGSNHATICKFSASENQRYEPVKDAIEELVIAGLGTTQKTSSMPLRSDMPLSTYTFCGREKELQEMAQALHPAKSRQTHDTDPGNPRPNGLVQFGIGGSGKTQLALRYIQKHGSLYKAIVWINASDAQNLEASFAEAADLLSEWPDNTAPRSSTASPQKLVIAKLCDPRSSPWLLIMDSVDDLNQHDFRACIPSCDHGSVIVTSTRANASEVFRFPKLEIDRLDEHSGCQLLRKIVGYVALPETDWVAKIVKELHGIPLAIEHAGVLIRTSLSPQQFLESYRERYRWLLAEFPDRGILSYDKNRSIVVVFDLLLKDLNKRYPQAGALLIFLAILGTWKIPTTFLNQYQHFLSEIQSADDEESQHLVQALGSPEALQITLSRLANVCLVRRDSLQGHLYKSITLHRAIRDWSLRTSLQGKQAWLLLAARGLVAATLCHDQQTCTLDVLRRPRTLDRAFLAPSRQSVALVRVRISWDDMLPPLGRFCRQYSELVVDLAQVNLSCGLLSEAERDFTDAITYQQKHQGPKWPSSRADLMLLEGLAVVRYRSGDLDSCIKTLRSALGLAEKLHGQLSPEAAAITSYSREVRGKREIMQQHHKRVVVARSSTSMKDAKAPVKGSREGAFVLPSHEEHQIVSRNHRIGEYVDVNAELLGAASDGNIENVKLLLGIGGLDVNAQDNHKSTALLRAAYHGHDSIVRLLLEVDQINVNLEDSSGNTPICVFTERGDYELVRTLLKRGADANATGGRYGNALQAASAKGHDKIVQMLLNHNVDVNAESGGACALTVASQKGYDRIVQMLLENDADPNAKHNYYDNPLYAASVEGHAKVVRILLEHGANVNSKGGKYGNPLYAATVIGHDNVVQLLVEHGADVNAQGTALRVAARRGHAEIVKILLEHDADVDRKDEYGSALQSASLAGYEKVVKILLEHGADVKAQCGHHGSALQAALVCRRNNILQMLLDRKARPPPYVFDSESPSMS